MINISFENKASQYGYWVLNLATGDKPLEGVRQKPKGQCRRFYKLVKQYLAGFEVIAGSGCVVGS